LCEWLPKLPYVAPQRSAAVVWGHMAPMETLRIGDVLLDLGAGCLRGDDGAEIALRPKAFDLLAVLVRNPRRTLSRDELLDTVWPGVTVTEESVTQCVREVRRAIGDPDGHLLRTVARRGYRLDLGVVPVALADDRVTAALTSAEPSMPSPVTALDRPDKPSIPPKAELPLSPRPDSPWAFRPLALVLAVLALLIVSAGAWWVWPQPKTPPAIDAAPSSDKSAALPIAAPRLSVVVLPFTNLSDDPQKQYLADGITEDLTTDVSRIADSFVISHTTAFTYKNKPINMKQIGRELGVRYLLEGSIQPLGTLVRVNAQLIDVQTDAHIWAQRFDRDMVDLFALQNEITIQIAGALNLALVRAEAARPTANPDALDFILRGRAVRLKPVSRDNIAEAIGFFERSLALDPGSAEAQIELASALTGRVLDEVSDAADADLARADQLIEKVLTIHPDALRAHTVKGDILRARRRWAEATREFERVIAVNDSAAYALHALSQCKLFTGAIDDVIPLEQKVMRLDPLDPQIGNKYSRIGFVYLLQSRIDDAILWLEKAQSANPQLPFIRSNLAAAYGLKGDIDRASAELAEARKLGRPGGFRSIAAVKAGMEKTIGDTPVIGLFESTYLVGLRKAGVPDD
jgi:adenylate cyclase